MNSTIICATIVQATCIISIHTVRSVFIDLTASLNDSGGEIDVICGYRTPWSNEFLRTRSPHTGVARHSLHMQAEAIDIRLPGIPTSVVRDAALRSASRRSWPPSQLRLRACGRGARTPVVVKPD